MFRHGNLYNALNDLKRTPEFGKMTPFRIVGNTYFVGTYQASSHLIDTGDGLILIDTGYENAAHLVLESIRELGFRPEDIKYIVNTHWHWDHTEATASFVALSGAKTLIGRDDRDRALGYFTPDILIDDGDTLTLGDTTITFLHTPGHTKGTISFFYDTKENGVSYRVGMFGGAGLNTLVPKCFEFEGCREAYFASLARLKQEKVDVFIGNHTWNNGTYEKSLRLLAGGENEFIDSEIWGEFLDSYRVRLETLIASEQSSKGD